MLSPDLNLNEKTLKLIDTIKSVIDKHAPMRLASKSKSKQLSKPWLTNGLLNSVKTKQKMYRTHFLNKHPLRIQQYKQYANMLLKIV